MWWSCLAEFAVRLRSCHLATWPAGQVAIFATLDQVATLPRSVLCISQQRNLFPHITMIMTPASWRFRRIWNIYGYNLSFYLWNIWYTLNKHCLLREFYNVEADKSESPTSFCLGTRLEVHLSTSHRPHAKIRLLEVGQPWLIVSHSWRE